MAVRAACKRLEALFLKRLCQRLLHYLHHPGAGGFLELRLGGPAKADGLPGDYTRLGAALGSREYGLVGN